MSTIILLISEVVKFMYSVFDKLLDERGVTASEVAKATGLRPSMFTDWKKGRYTPKADKLQKVADYFGVTLRYLQTGKTEESGYYISPEAAKTAHDAYVKYGMLFDAAEGASAEDIQFCIDFLNRVKATNKND